jgi:leader peptidase (prepilin peptidase) / N-methyltransferase
MTILQIGFVLITAMVFAAAAWGGARLGPMLVATHAPSDDGPPAIAFAAWPFLALGALVGAASAHDLAWPQLALLALVVGLLAACAAADLRYGLIPDSCSLGALGVVLLASAFGHDWAPLFGAVAVGGAFAAAALLTGGRAMGWGDVKLAAAGGALLGAFDASFAFTLAALAAYALARLSRRTRGPIAFGPYLAVSTAIALAFQRPL